MECSKNGFETLHLWQKKCFKTIQSTVFETLSSQFQVAFYQMTLYYFRASGGLFVFITKHGVKSLSVHRGAQKCLIVCRGFFPQFSCLYPSTRSTDPMDCGFPAAAPVMFQKQQRSSPRRGWNRTTIRSRPYSALLLLLSSTFQTSTPTMQYISQPSYVCSIPVGRQRLPCQLDALFGHYYPRHHHYIFTTTHHQGHHSSLFQHHNNFISADKHR